jgi:hypothetical protein
MLLRIELFLEMPFSVCTLLRIKKTNPVRILKTQNGVAILRFGITSIFGVGKEHKKTFLKGCAIAALIRYSY